MWGTGSSIHSQLHDQVVMCAALVEVLQPHHILMLYPETQREALQLKQTTQSQQLGTSASPRTGFKAEHVSGRSSPPQDVDFILQVAVSQMFLLQTLQSVEPTCFLLPYHEDLWEGAPAQRQQTEDEASVDRTWCWFSPSSTLNIHDGPKSPAEASCPKRDDFHPLLVRKHPQNMAKVLLLSWLPVLTLSSTSSLLQTSALKDVVEGKMHCPKTKGWPQLFIWP